MTQFDSSNNLSVLSSKLNELETAMLQAIKATQSRNRSLLTLSVLMIVFLCGYLGYAYYRFGGEVTPDLVASNVQSGFEQYLPQAKEQLESNLISGAPRFVGDAFEQAKALPAQFADSLNSEAGKRIDDAMPSVENDLVASLRTGIQNGSKSAKGTDEERFKTTLSVLSQTYGDETLKFVDRVHTDYTNQATSFTDYINKLATSPNLDKRDELHRDMLKTMFALIKYHANNSAPGDHLKTTLTQPVQ